jgi:hypothetical protein
MNTRDKGEVARLRVMLRAAELGYVVSLPTTQVRYDLVLEKDGRFFRAQVKYADGAPGHASGSVRLALYRRGRLYMDGEVDLILVYLPKLDRICCFGPDLFHNRLVLQIRYEPTRSGQVQGCLMASDYFW